MTEHEQQSFAVGCDYWPLDDERRPVSEWYDRDVAQDFVEMASAGLTRARVFASWHLMEPQVAQYDEGVFARLDGVIAAAAAAGLGVVVCFFADDRLSGLTQVAWAGRRDVYTDDYLRERQSALVQRLVMRYRGNDAVVAWELADEAFCRGFRSEGDLESWTVALREAIRDVDPERPVSIGVDPETMMRATGVDPRSAIDFCEEARSHVTADYRRYAADEPFAKGAPTYLTSFLLRIAADELPVVVDGIGPHAPDASPAEEATLVRGALYSALMNGAAGAMLRRWRDVATDRRIPYHLDSLEALVGVIDEAGNAKAMLGEVTRFAAIATALSDGGYTLVPDRTAVLMAAERHEPLPSLAGVRTPRVCLRAFAAAKQAHLPVTVVREGERFTGLRAIFVPSVGRLAPETWRSLASFMQSGGSVALSYGGGEADPALREIFGVESLGDAGARGSLGCRVAQPGLLPGVEPFEVPVASPHFARLAAGDSTVVATDAQGAPLITARTHGQGRAVFVAAPLERIVAEADPSAYPVQVASLVRAVYSAVAGAAGAGGAVGCSRSDVEIAHFIGAVDDVVILLSHAPERRSVTLTFPRTVAQAADLRGGDPVALDAPAFEVQLGRNGAAAFRLSYRREEA